MALTRKSATLGANNNAATTWTVTTNEATATAVGDVVLVVHSNDYYALSNMGTPSATGSPTMNAISGATADGGASQPHIKMWWYVANTAGAQTVTFTETGTPDEERAGFLVVYGGADTINPVDAAAATAGLQASSTSVVAPSVTTTYADDQVLAYAAVAGTTNPTFTSPGSLTELADWNVGGSFGGGTAGGGVLSAAGATGTFTFTASVASTYVAATVAIKAARPVLAYSEAVYSAASDNTSSVSSAFTVTNGDVIVVKTASEDQAAMNPTSVTASGQTFTDKNTDSTTNLTNGHIYAATVTGNPGTLTVTVAYSGAGWHSAVFERWTSAQLAATPATNSTKNVSSAGGFTGLITTAAADSAITWSAGDWTPNAPGTPGYRSGATQDGLHDKASTNNYVAYYAYQFTAAAGSQTFGLTTPAATSAWKYLALEIQYLGSGGGGGAPAAQRPVWNNLQALRWSAYW